jgi:uncharacterized protein
VFISLQQLEQRPVQFKVDLPAGEIEFDSKITQSTVLHSEGAVNLLNHALGEIRVQGKLNVTVSATCDRCLEAASIAIDNDFDLVYMPAGESAVGEEEIDQEAIEVGFYEGNGLELNDVLREIVLLALPMRVVCSEACRGICPVCGRNRNQTDCGCHEDAIDDRWSKLRSLKTEVGRQN